MEIFQVESIIHHLVNISLQRVFLPDLEFKAKNNSTKQKHNMYAFAKTRNVVLENYLSIFILPRRKNRFQQLNFALPSFVGGGKSIAVVIAMQLPDNRVYISFYELGKTV